jgi:peptidoglycan/xylan/chitin deacetylase (PgdA/CDA1 family)
MHSVGIRGFSRPSALRPYAFNLGHPMSNAHLALIATLALVSGAAAEDGAAPARLQSPRSVELAAVAPAHATPGRKMATPHLLEPRLRVARSGDTNRRRIALTFDACMGKTDLRILSLLVSERVPATLFVTARWLRSNPQAAAVLKQNADLFEIENHGRDHVPAVEARTLIYGIAAAGSRDAVRDEVAGGAAAIQAAGFAPPRWFRGSTARYDTASINQIRAMGYKVAGYSINGDGGSLLGAAMTERTIAAAKDGDVVIAHINQPTHSAGDGVVRAILSLKKRGVEFVRLQDVEETGDHDTTGTIVAAAGQ